MRLAFSRRHLLLGAALLATLAAMAWASQLETDPPATVAEPVASAPSAPATPPAVGRVQLEQLRQPQPSQANAFAARSFYVPPPAPKRAAVPAPLPPPPSAPPLPFTFVGILKEADAMVAFVARGEKLLTLRVGEVVDGSYRVEAIDSAGVTFRYLPLDETQRLAPGESS